MNNLPSTGGISPFPPLFAVHGKHKFVTPFWKHKLVKRQTYASNDKRTPALSGKMVAGGRIELPTLRFSIACSTN